MATIAEQITALQNALAAGTKSVTIGDRSVTYHGVDEMLKALSFLKAQQSDGDSSSPFTVTQINYSKGL